MPSTSVANPQISQLTDKFSPGVCTFFLEEDPALRDYNGHVAVDKALTIVVRQGNSDVGIFDADIEGDAEDTLRFFCGRSAIRSTEVVAATKKCER